ncbi:DNA N-6-adenine-methyltransferase [Pantoea phage vB_PagM_AAM37]|uniref:DNA N-6-adenine-methyltransferase n=1 Tax=Pantoea phage vB_PagM_AAM37 TaxID=2588093 RepID=A0A513ZYG9_9CAUD|nr:DNA methyltransferase [Pantoea phage vB_PagM_AAM37]QDH45712.1 DNA N-6-adenine-methyltransferase [Pantoea phage vB_PagM_AAM37]
MKDDNDKATFDLEDILGGDGVSAAELQVSRRYALAGHYQAVKPCKHFAVTGKRHLGSNTPDVARDAWQTPKWLFNHFAQMAGGFDIDAAANEHNALCESFFSETDDALSFDWDAGKKYWLNPPYSNILPWVEHAVVQGERPGSVVYMLLPDDVSTLWFRTAMDNAAEAYIIAHDGVKGSAGRSGRVQFVNAITGKTGNGNNKGSWVFVFRRHRVPVKIRMIDRTICEASGDTFF